MSNSLKKNDVSSNFIAIDNLESECVMLQKGMLLFDTAQYDGILKKLHMFNSSLATDEVVPCFITFYLIGMQELNDFGDANHILTGKERVRPQ